MLQDVFTIAPEIYLSGLILLILMVDIFSPKVSYHFSLFGILPLFYLLFRQVSDDGQPVFAFSQTFVMDSMSQVAKTILTIGTFIVFLTSRTYLRGSKVIQGEYFALMLCSLLGMYFLVSANDMMVFFLGLELMTLPVFGLVGIKTHQARRSEAAIKYLVLGGLSTGIFLMGISFAYGASGSLSITDIRATFEKGTEVFTIFGAVLMLVGVCFKVSIFPFHAWAPDVYEGAPTPVTGFMSVCVKIAAFVGALRLFGGINDIGPFHLTGVLSIFAAVTIIVGNLLAVTQSNVKRILAYSSIANAGFMLLAFIGKNPNYNLLVYASIYMLGNLTVFAVLGALRPSGHQDETMQLDEFKGLGVQYPVLSLCFLLGILSIAGIPPFPGFYAKFIVIKECVQNELYVLVSLVLISTVSSMYYYLKIVIYMFMKDKELSSALLVQSNSSRLALFLGAVSIIALAILPTFVFDKINFLIR